MPGSQRRRLRRAPATVLDPRASARHLRRSRPCPTRRVAGCCRGCSSGATRTWSPIGQRPGCGASTSYTFAELDPIPDSRRALCSGSEPTTLATASATARTRGPVGPSDITTMYAAPHHHSATSTAARCWRGRCRALAGTAYAALKRQFARQVRTRLDRTAASTQRSLSTAAAESRSCASSSTCVDPRVESRSESRGVLLAIHDAGLQLPEPQYCDRDPRSAHVPARLRLSAAHACVVEYDGRATPTELAPASSSEHDEPRRVLAQRDTRLDRDRGPTRRLHSGDALDRWLGELRAGADSRSYTNRRW